MAKPDFGPPNSPTPDLPIATSTEDSRSHLKSFIENPHRSDFAHLVKYPGTTGSFLDVPDMIEAAIEGYSLDRTPQVIVLMGHQGNGKSSLAKLIIRDIEGKIPDPSLRPRIRYVGYDNALKTASSLKMEVEKDVQVLENLDPSHVSGTRTQDDYVETNSLFEGGIEGAIKGGGIIIVEAPGDGGFMVGGEIVGKDRGTTVIQKLSKEGFHGLKYRLSVVAVIASEDVYRKSFEERSSKAEGPFSDLTGASGLGQAVADEDLRKVLGWHFLVDSPKFEDLPANTDYIAAFFYWVVSQYFKSAQSIILKNSLTQDMDPPKNKDFNPYDEFKKMSKGRKYALLFRRN